MEMLKGSQLKSLVVPQRDRRTEEKVLRSNEIMHFME